MSVRSFSSSTRLRQRCKMHLANVEIPRPWDLQEFCERLARQRGRDLALTPVPQMEGTLDITGAWLALEDYDVVFFHPNTSPWHREQIVLHECAHMVSGHVPSIHTADGLIAECLVAHFTPAAVAKVLLRSRYDAPIEQEAEVLAGLIDSVAERDVGRGSPLPDQGSSAVDDEALRRFAAVFAAGR